MSEDQEHQKEVGAFVFRKMDGAVLRARSPAGDTLLYDIPSCAPDEAEDTVQAL